MKMENNELKKVSIKNRACYYFDNIIKFEDFDFDNILLGWKFIRKYFGLWRSYKTLIGAKLLCIMFDIIDRFIKGYDGPKY